MEINSGCGLFVCVLVSTWVADYLLVAVQCPSSNLLLSWTPPRPHLLGGPPERVQYVISFRTVNGSDMNITLAYSNDTLPVQVGVALYVCSYVSFIGVYVCLYE